MCPPEDAASAAAKVDAPSFMTSAKSGENVENAFSALGRRLIRDTLGKEKTR